ncbi:ankyrin repeat and SAM domain-containing protein 6 [Canna indica]|uniref:Ankyrin repeat and SAM domain-containing protein 6 n=1 Tax=Canna indica TaxID=4628 RepID=A0AAQ3K527_9LILI|nr:ankyrin repeat and SAM domain-containing protein 6 [Canna indica]
MYADQITAGRKRSIKERLDGDLGGEVGRPSIASAKRQRQSDDKWKHDLYEDDAKSKTSKSVDPSDLRWKLQRKGSQQAHQSGKVSAVRDLRDKLSGIMHVQPPNTDPSKAKRVSEISETIKKNLRRDPPVQETKKVTNPTTRKTSHQKSELAVDGFLHSLGLEKYLITFQAEEVDMAALKHMNDEDLRALGIPMVCPIVHDLKFPSMFVTIFLIIILKAVDIK